MESRTISKLHNERKAMRKRDQVMLCYPYNEERFLKWGSAIIQPKLDGDRCLARVVQGEVNLYSSTGLLITSVPHINKELKESIGEHEGFELDGELYCHGMKHPEISGLVRTKKGVPEEARKLQYHIFDMSNFDVEYRERLRVLSYLVPEHGSIRQVAWSTVSTVDGIFQGLREYIDQGYEGFVLKNPTSLYEYKRSTNWMKFKPRMSDSYLILGVVEEISIHGEPKGQLGALILTDWTQQFKVGTGFTQQQRRDLWDAQDRLPGRLCSIKFQELSKDGIPREPVFIEIL